MKMGDKEIIISVIVTIHNAEKYIHECMESVLSQTFFKIEILCMDGGSTDSSPQILKEYAEKDDRIRIINDSNTSYGHKVNRGIEEAKGEYVSVLESDDMYEPFMLEKLYQIAEQYQTDFVNADYTSFFDINGLRFAQIVKMYPEENYDCLINYKECPERFGTIPRYWTGLFRKSYLEREKIKMNESPGASFQDMSFRFLTSILARRAYHLHIPVYLYRIDNPDSSMHDYRKTTVIADEHEFLRNELVNRNIADSYIWHNWLQWKYTDFRGNMSLLRGKYRQELLERYRKELESDRGILDKYSAPGYSQGVLEIIGNSPETVLELVEADSAIAQEQSRQLYAFLKKTVLSGERRIVIFGCGKIGEKLLALFRFNEDKICCLTDNSKMLWNTAKKGHIVLSPLEAVKQFPDAQYIVANKLHADDIVEQLKLMGISEEMIVVY